MLKRVKYYFQFGNLRLNLSECGIGHTKLTYTPIYFCDYLEELAALHNLHGFCLNKSKFVQGYLKNIKWFWMEDKSQNLRRFFTYIRIRYFGTGLTSPQVQVKGVIGVDSHVEECTLCCSATPAHVKSHTSFDTFTSEMTKLNLYLKAIN